MATPLNQPPQRPPTQPNYRKWILIGPGAMLIFWLVVVLAAFAIRLITSGLVISNNPGGTKMKRTVLSDRSLPLFWRQQQCWPSGGEQPHRRSLSPRLTNTAARTGISRCTSLSMRWMGSSSTLDVCRKHAGGEHVCRTSRNRVHQGQGKRELCQCRLLLGKGGTVMVANYQTSNRVEVCKASYKYQ